MGKYFVQSIYLATIASVIDIGKARDHGISFIIYKVLEMSSAQVLTGRCSHRECNSHYAEVCNSSSGTDKYVSESVQTLKGPVKNKQVQTDCVAFVDSGKSQDFIWKQLS